MSKKNSLSALESTFRSGAHFRSAKRWIVFSIATMLFILSMFYRASITVIASQLSVELEFSSGKLSIISASFFYAFALTQIPISLYLDRIGPRWMMSLLSLVGASGSFLFAASHSFHTITLARILMGIGMACNLMGTLKLITLWFGPRWFGTLSALVVSLGTAGSILAFSPLAYLTEILGWRNTFVFIGLVNLMLVFFFFVLVRDDSKKQAGSSPQRKDFIDLSHAVSQLKSLFMIKDYWLISIGTFARYGILGAVQSLWAGPFLIQMLKFSPMRAANILDCMNIGIVIGCPLFGWISDSVWYSRKKVIVAGLVGMSVFLFLLSFLNEESSFSILCVLFFFFGASSSAGQNMYAHIKELVPLEKSGTAMTGVNFFTMMGGGIFLQVMGELMDFFLWKGSLPIHAYKMAFLFCGIVLLVTAFIYGGTLETLGRKKQV